mmetsp:Transcript_21742/g.73698  ORF Transcript_21742/g.73698 Transcript_21742/m.73698 type:complete len:202 (+) Transcript_21742:533-1138(+)
MARCCIFTSWRIGWSGASETAEREGHSTTQSSPSSSVTATSNTAHGDGSQRRASAREKPSEDDPPTARTADATPSNHSVRAGADAASSSSSSSSDRGLVAADFSSETLRKRTRAPIAGGASKSGAVCSRASRHRPQSTPSKAHAAQARQPRAVATSSAKGHRADPSTPSAAASDSAELDTERSVETPSPPIGSENARSDRA